MPSSATWVLNLLLNADVRELLKSYGVTIANADQFTIGLALSFSQE